ncbi:DUF2207 domain-containing protein [Streptomyces sp. SID8379]|uniref:DUF2207 domain-containing protein n=1 Tax=unclassified Streptomyces TaxID=2593676 RepID=UPI00037CBE34|nr:MULTISPECIES: DUF2207 domain-containing protein [unclassified Streptomyces]MYW68752.1 DUF2207 domain-containing protein [Streptomyces sp. SID8379]
MSDKNESGTVGAGRPRSSGARRRRVRGLVWMVFLALALGCVTWFAGAAGNSERVTRMWVSAKVAKDGSARVTEVIDYDFGHPTSDRHGIFRDIPGLTYEVDDEDVHATMDGGPVPYELSYGETTERSIRVGDADRTVSGLHRYRITYPLPDVVKKGKLAWDAVGTGWQVDLRNVEIHVAAPYGLDATRCVRGRTGSTQSCRAAQPDTGHLVAAPGNVAPGNGVTLYASAAARGAAVQAARPTPPAGARPDAEAAPDPLWTGLTVAGLALGCGLLAVGALRLLGRDRRPADLERPAEGTPPEALTPAQGGILLSEHVEPHHQVAWLLHTAFRRHINIRGTGQHPTLRRTRGLGGVPDADTTAVLDDMFAGRAEFVLGMYDPLFRSAWQSLGTRLAEWQRTSDLWDPASERRERVARLTGLGATLLGLVAAIIGSVLISHMNTAGWPMSLAGALVTGAGLALCLRAWELKRRSARGAALRLQVETFRQWLTDASPEAVGDATADAERFELLTAWAVALGLAQRWERSIATSTAPATTGGTRRSTAFAQLGPALAVGLITAAAVSATAPSSSGSGGSGGSGGGGSSGGGVGGGTGGGGGGSW